MATIDLTEPTVLHSGCVYLIELEEHIGAPADAVRTRESQEHHGTPRRVHAPGDGLERRVRLRDPEIQRRLYADVMPRTFNVRVQAGLCLSQLRLIANEADAAVTDRELLALDAQETLVYANEGSENAVIDRGIWLSVNLEATTPDRQSRTAPRERAAGRHARTPSGRSPAGKRSNRSKTAADPQPRGLLHPRVARTRAGAASLRGRRWYPAIRASASCGSTTPGSSTPASGTATERSRARAQCSEVRAHETPFAIEHGQVLGRLEYSRMAGMPERQYGPADGIVLPGPGTEPEPTVPDVTQARINRAGTGWRGWAATSSRTRGPRAAREHRAGPDEATPPGDRAAHRPDNERGRARFARRGPTKTPRGPRRERRRTPGNGEHPMGRGRRTQPGTRRDVERPYQNDGPTSGRAGEQRPRNDNAGSEPSAGRSTRRPEPRSTGAPRRRTPAPRPAARREDWAARRIRATRAHPQNPGSRRTRDEANAEDPSRASRRKDGVGATMS